MSTSPRIISALLISSALVCSSLNAGTVQGIVKGQDGKAISGAEVHVSPDKTQSALQKVKTDKSGGYVFKNLPDGKRYTITAWVNRVPTAIGNVMPRAEGAIRIDFDIKSGAVATKAAKKAKHWVYVPATTGSHLGGRWVEVDEQGNSAATGLPVQTASGEQLKKMYRGSSFGSSSGHAGQ